MSKDSQKILIPKHLATAIASDKAARKAVSTWLRLKNATKSGSLPYNQKTLLAITGVSRHTLAARLKYLKKEKLITITKTRLMVCDWDMLGFRLMGKINLKFYYVHTSENLEHVLIRFMIKESLRSQRKQIAKKVKKHGDYATTAAPAEALKNDLVNQFRTDDAIQVPVNINPAVTLSQKGIAKRLALTTHSAGRYYVMLFVKSGKMKVTQGEIIQSVNKCRETALGAVKWSKKHKVRFVKTCNIIEILPHVVKN